MKNVTTIISDCMFWKRLDIGTVLRMPDLHADKAIVNHWAEETSSDKLLFLGERVRLAKGKK